MMIVPDECRAGRHERSFDCVWLGFSLLTLRAFRIAALPQFLELAIHVGVEKELQAKPVIRASARITIHQLVATLTMVRRAVINLALAEKRIEPTCWVLYRDVNVPVVVALGDRWHTATLQDLREQKRQAGLRKRPVMAGTRFQLPDGMHNGLQSGRPEPRLVGCRPKAHYRRVHCGQILEIRGKVVCVGWGKGCHKVIRCY